MLAVEEERSLAAGDMVDTAIVAEMVGLEAADIRDMRVVHSLAAM